MIPYLALLPVGVIGMAGRLDRHPPDCVIGMRRNQRSFSPEYALNLVVDGQRPKRCAYTIA
jgi:hypothetical protein